MGKSKVRKNRKIRPHRNIQQLATLRAGKNFMKMIAKGAHEGNEHKLTIELEDGSVSTSLTVEPNGNTIVGDPTVTEFIVTTLTMGQTAAITLETFAEDERYLRAWLVDSGQFYPAKAKDAEESALESGEAQDEWPEGKTHYRDAYRFTEL